MSAQAAAAALPSRAESLAQLMALRDELVRSTSAGRFHDAASREWRKLPTNWRMALLLMAGVGDDMADMELLAERRFSEFSEEERQNLRWMARSAKTHLGAVVALAALD